MSSLRPTAAAIHTLEACPTGAHAEDAVALVTHLLANPITAPDLGE
jgi:hypothetical protein